MNKLVEIVKSFYGMTTKQAKKYLETITESQKQALIQGFESNAKKNFYED